jgi:outer membrane protein OmpA-like peptidoglycan-associated protein
VRPLEIGSVPARELSGPQEFTILYSFNDDYLEYAGNRLVTQAIEYAKRIQAASVKVTGYRATSVLSNGQRMVEKDGLAERRAQNIATLMRGSGVARVTVGWKGEPEPGDGQADPSRRRVTIAVTP